MGPSASPGIVVQNCGYSGSGEVQTLVGGGLGGGRRPALSSSRIPEADRLAGTEHPAGERVVLVQVRAVRRVRGP